MEHLSSFELYEYAKFRDMVKGDAFVSPKKNELSFNIRPIRKIIISDELKNNKFNIDYNTEIGVLYNDSEEHINFNYHKSLIKKDVTITQPIKGKTPLSSKSFSKIMKKR